jgi:hypothetical protein
VLRLTPAIIPPRASTTSILPFWRRLPTNRHVRIASTAFAAPQGALEARTTKAPQRILTRVRHHRYSWGRTADLLGRGGRRAFGLFCRHLTRETHALAYALRNTGATRRVHEAMGFEPHAASRVPGLCASEIATLIFVTGKARFRDLWPVRRWASRTGKRRRRPTSHKVV